MGKSILRRLLSVIPVLLIVSFAVFFLLALVPGDPAVTLAGGLSATPAEIARVRAQLHLNDPLVVQYWHWLSNALHGNLGTSLSTGQSVSSQIAARFPVTFGLVVASAIVSLLVGIPLGIISGIRPRGAIDSGARAFSTLGLADTELLAGDHSGVDLRRPLEASAADRLYGHNDFLYRVAQGHPLTGDYPRPSGGSDARPPAPRLAHRCPRYAVRPHGMGQGRDPPLRSCCGTASRTRRCPW